MSRFRELTGRVAALAGARLFFIGGAPKSGTTWIQLLLDAHPRIVCRGETHAINHLGPLLLDAVGRHNRMLEPKSRVEFAELPRMAMFDEDDTLCLLGGALLLLLGKDLPDPPPLVLGEKTPDHVRCFAVLRAIFPEARFIHVVRDGRDCVVSGWFHSLRQAGRGGDEGPRIPADYVGLCAREWAKDLDDAERFASRHPGVCATVRYEDMLAAPVPTLARLFGFLGLEADEAVAARCHEAACFERLSGGRRRGEARAGSFFRRGVAGDWRGHLPDGLAEAFRREAGGWLDRFGYV